MREIAVCEQTEHTAEDYRREAERVRREAAAAKNESMRQHLLTIAAAYDGLALTVETINRQRRGL